MLDSSGGDPRVPRRFSLRNKKWKYRGEGNANLVLALTQERKIVRLRKCDGAGGNEGEDVLAEREREHVWREAVFCRGVMVPLLGECYIQPPTAARMDRGEVRRLDQMLRTQRPAYRHHKSLQFGYVTVYPDYALLPVHLSVPPNLPPKSEFLPTFCVEVKPKQGWVPAPDRRLSKCTFCLNQYLKLKNGSIRCQSLYCPLDLFSGNRARMMKALQALVAAPQNNLKIFKDGVLVYGEEACSDLPTILQNWFCDPLQPLEATNVPRYARLISLCTDPKPILKQGCCVSYSSCFTPTPLKTVQCFMTVFCFQDGVLVYGEEACSDLPTILQNWFCDPLQPLEATNVPRLVDKLCCLVLEALTSDLTGPEKLSDSETDNESDNDIALWETGCEGLVHPTSLPDGYGSNGCHRVSGSGLKDRIPAALVAAVAPLLPGPSCDWTAEPFPVDCILARILRVQKLEQTGTDRVYEAYRGRTRVRHLVRENVATSDYDYVADMLSARTEAGPGLSPLHRYLLATTAKDCSIMLAFQRLPDQDCRLWNHIPAHHVVQDSDGCGYVVNVGVTDLDPKPLSCIEKHRKRDCEVLTACLELLRPQAGSESKLFC
ncbi:inositol-pentakisphosphate 2-kinase [Zootermopsis nevadensis]|uniref:inositol-pentakisphosphate 2-kinase n=1 Tax=Zootermopsis nevadensis TaxID=136037 RepID=UPI000B8E3E13|nr:inositol-pentakisphosphate 2-kinase [Zootermopsis nevadensis]